MKKRIRIKDIAEQAQVSTGTVDRVLHKRGNVSPDVRKKVQSVIEKLGYERNVLASTLAYNKHARIVSLLPYANKDMFWAQMKDGMEHAVKTVQHYGLMVEQYYFDYEKPESFLEIAKQALDNSPDGVIFPPIFSQEAKWFSNECSYRGIPFVIINTNLEGVSPLCYLGQDSFQSGILGAKLLNLGQTVNKVFCILNLDYRTKSAQHLLKKENGFRSYFETLGEAHVKVVRQDFDQFDDPVKLKKFLLNLLDRYSDLKGIFVTNSRAFKVVECVGELISKRGIGIVGYDLVPQNLRFLQKNKIDFLIHQHPFEQGFKGIYTFYRHLIEGEKIKGIQHLRLDIVVKENHTYHIENQDTIKQLLM